MTLPWLSGLLIAASPLLAQSTPILVVRTNAVWAYAKGTQEASQPNTQSWRLPSFDDSRWPRGNAPFAYGEAAFAGGVQLTDMQNLYSTLFLRAPFFVTNAADIVDMELTAVCDDGFIAWINGVEVARAGGPTSEPTFNSLASVNATEPIGLIGYPMVDPERFLVTGTNWLAVQVFNVSLGSSDLVFDAELAATVKPPAEPLVTAVDPAPDSALTNLVQVTVTFSEPVTGVDAADLLVNDIPCTGLTGGGSTYTFTFDRPEYGTVQFSWNMRAGIADLGTPAIAFNPTGPGARWVYELYDPTGPRISALNPPAGATVRRLSQVEIVFDRPVDGVDAADLLVNGQAASRVTGVAAGPYVFEFPPVTTGTVTLAWRPNPGIVDFSPAAHPFVGDSWPYLVNPQAVVPNIILSEFMAENVTGLKDEDGDAEDWIELYNRGDTAVNLDGWALTDDPRVPGKWAFPSRTLGARQYLVVYASGKDRRSANASARLHTNFKLSITGEYLGLYNAESPRVPVSQLEPEYPEQRHDQAFGRDALGNWGYLSRPTPGAANAGTVMTRVVEPVHFSVKRGFFVQPFALSLACPTPGATIRYTIDGSVPGPTNGIDYTSPIPMTATRILRAAAFRTNWVSSPVTTHTYLFNLPATRRLLPALSLVTASNHLYGKSGIMEYNPRNTYNHGIAWERPVSAELIRPEDNGGFQVDCGIRIQGGGYIRGLYNYRSSAIPESKYSFRLYFRGDYGPGRLEYPLFPGVPVTSFDTIVLRAGMNDATNPFIRDELARQLEADVGQVSARGTFVNLFLNGVYKGYYNPTERIDIDFLRTYHGGGDRWDLLAAAGEVREGDAVAWNSLRDYARNNDLTLRDKYLEVERRLDTTNFVEYLIPLIYADTDDWPHNNYRCARERVPGQPFRFYAWDAEWSFGYNNSVSHNTIASQLSNLSPPWGGTDLQTLFLRLKTSPEFRLLFADRVHRHFFNGGAMTDERILARYNWLKAQIAPTIPGFNNTIATSWIASRRRYLTNHFAAAGFLASSNAPAFSRMGGNVPLGYGLTLSAGPGTIYYTLDGTDPRVRFTGQVAPSAAAYQSDRPIVLDRSVTVRARTQWTTTWSAVTEATFHINDFGSPLRITELMYHPPGGEAYEFLELANTSSLPADLGGVHFEGIEFRFLDGTMLPGGARIILISSVDPNAFARRYPGVAVFGQYQGSLSNGGERIALVDRNGRRLQVIDYDDQAPWPVEADGGGRSLEIIDAMGGSGDPSNWQASAQPGGSPGLPNPPRPVPQVRLNELNAAGNPSRTATLPPSADHDWFELFNAGSSPADVSGWSVVDWSGSHRFVFPTHVLAPGEYLVLHCDTNTVAAEWHTGFGLNHDGDALFLLDGQGARVDAVTFGAQAPGYSLGRLGDGTTWGLTEPTPGAANESAVLGQPADLHLNEFVANSSPGSDDWLELYNANPTLPVALQGLFLGTSNALFRLPNPAFIAPRGFVLFHADEGSAPNHLAFKLPAARGTIVLHDPFGVELDRVDYTNAPEGVSLGRFPDGAGNLLTFTLSMSPAASNYLVDYVGPHLNEIMARNQAAVTNASGRVVDWIELYNPGPTPTDLAGMSLSLDKRRPGQWVFPPGCIIAGRGYLIVWCDAERPASAGAEPVLNCGHSLRGEGGGVYLFTASGQLVNAVEYGFQLPDQTIGLTGGAWNLLEAPSAGSANRGPARLGDPAKLRLNEWISDPSGRDWIEVFNPGPLPVNLAGLTVTDDPSVTGQTNHLVGALSYIAPQGWVVWQADGEPDQGPDHLPFRLDALGETLRLYGPGAVTIDTIDRGPMTPGVAEGRFPDGATNLVRFPDSPSPGEANYLPLPTVCIHEVLAHTDPPLEDAIEFANPKAEPVSIAGWWLSDNPNWLKKFQLPPDFVIPGNGFGVVYAYQFAADSTSPAAVQLSSAHGGKVILAEADGAGNLTGYRAEVQFGASANGVSFGLQPTSAGADFVPLSWRTFGNDAAQTLAEFRAGHGAANAPPLVGPIVITEIMYRPAASLTAAADEDPGLEYLELRNLSGDAVPLYDPSYPANAWKITGGVEFEFPPQTVFPPGEHLLLVRFDPATDNAGLAAFRARYGVPSTAWVLGPFRGRLANEGEAITLCRPDTPQAAGRPDAGFVPYLQVERIRYSPSLPWPPGASNGFLSLQRISPNDYGNEPQNWRAAWPTPGRVNFDDPDMDQDGLPDDWELANGLNPESSQGNDGADGDPDGDGLTNRDEFLTQSDPNLRSLVVTGLVVEGDNLRLTFNAVAGVTYAIEYRDAFDAATWRSLVTVPPVASARLVQFPLALPSDQTARFYRVRAVSF